MSNVVFWLLLLALGLLCGWLFLSERNRDLNAWTANNCPPEPGDNVRCLFCSGDPAWCRCRDITPSN